MKYNLLKLSALSAMMSPAFAALHQDAQAITPYGTKSIKDLQVGDLVRAFSPAAGGNGMGEVLAKSRSFCDQSRSVIEIYLEQPNADSEIGSTIKTLRAMPNQLLFDVNAYRYCKAKDITVDNVLYGEDGSPLTVLGTQRKRRNSYTPLYEVTVDHKHNLFVDGVLSHNMDANDWVKEGIKKTVMTVLPSEVVLFAGAAGKVGEWAYEGMQQEKAAIASGDFIPVDRPASFAEQSGAWNAKPDPVVETPPAAAPRKVNQARVEQFRREVVKKPKSRVIDPAPSSNRAIVQVPDYSPPAQNTGFQIPGHNAPCYSIIMTSNGPVPNDPAPKSEVRTEKEARENAASRAEEKRAEAEARERAAAARVESERAAEIERRATQIEADNALYEQFMADRDRKAQDLSDRLAQVNKLNRMFGVAPQPTPAIKALPHRPAVAVVSHAHVAASARHLAAREEGFQRELKFAEDFARNVHIDNSECTIKRRIADNVHKGNSAQNDRLRDLLFGGRPDLLRGRQPKK